MSLEFEGSERSAWSLGRGSNTGFHPGPSSPAFQVYDGSTYNDETLALTFFTLADPELSDQEVGEQCAGQLSQQTTGGANKAALSGFRQVHVQRWPLEEFISDEKHPTSIHPHPSPVSALAEPDWDGRLLFAGTESDLASPGVMEGAIGAAQRVLASLNA